ncbi:hypothetical protein ABTK52_19445, partial [Acinetobacter baumannii]
TALKGSALDLTPPSNLGPCVKASTSFVSAVALKSDGTVAVWGSNQYSQLNIPSGLAQVADVVSGFWCNLAVKQDGT